MSISAKDASKKDISFKDIKVHIEQELKIIDERIMAYPVIPGQNTLEYPLPNLESILNNYTQESLSDLKIIYYGKIITSLRDRGFIVAFHNDKNTGDMLLISWESEFDTKDFDKCLSAIKDVKLMQGEKTIDFKMGKAPYERLKNSQIKKQ